MWLPGHGLKGRILHLPFFPSSQLIWYRRYLVMQMKQHLRDGRTTRKKETGFLPLSSHHNSTGTPHWTIPQSSNKCLFYWSHCVCMWSLRSLTYIPPNIVGKWQSLDLNCRYHLDCVISFLPLQKSLYWINYFLSSLIPGFIFCLYPYFSFFIWPN